MIDELRWLIGLNFIFSVWLGVLANSWKGRRIAAWWAIGMVASVVGLALLAFLPKIVRHQRVKTPRDLNSRRHSYGH